MSDIVTQVDREAAAEISRAFGIHQVQHIIDGIEDDTRIVQIAVRHRIAAEAAAIEQCAKAFEDAITRGYASPEIGEECCHGIGPSRDCIACYDDELHSAIAAICARSPQ